MALPDVTATPGGLDVNVAVNSLAGNAVVFGRTTASFSSALTSSTLLEFEGGALYEAAGYAVNPQNGRRLGLFPGTSSNSLFVLDGPSNTAFYLNAKSGSSSCPGEFLPRPISSPMAASPRFRRRRWPGSARGTWATTPCWATFR